MCEWCEGGGIIVERDEDSLNCTVKAVSIVWSIHPLHNSQVNGPHQSLHSDLC